MNTAAIAKHLNVVESAIVRIEEWANVLFCVVRGVGARFVSKKVVKMDSLDLARLEGSEKQVSWAEKIREEKIRFVESRLADAGITGEESQKSIGFLASQPKAKFWIENRDVPAIALGLFAAGMSGYQFGRECFVVQEKLTVKEKVNGEWIEKSSQTYESQTLAVRFKSQLTPEKADKVWLELDLETGKIKIGTGEFPKETDNTYVRSLSKVLSSAQVYGWASSKVSFALIRHSSNGYKVDLVFEV